MENISKQIDDFFSSYEERFNKGLAGLMVDTSGAVNSFAECFVEASPAGVLCGFNDHRLAGKIQEGFDFYRKIGTESMKIFSKNITVLDDYHYMVKVHWVYTAHKDGEKVVIEFEVFYLLQHRNEEMRIFCYISGDEQKTLKHYGLIPSLENSN